MDEVLISTALGRKIIKHLLEKAIKKALSRKIDIEINRIHLKHKDQEKVTLALELVAEMTEAELNALIEQIGG